jgi:hypothetical protein
VKFKADDNVISAVRTWLHEQDNEWYQRHTRTYFSLAQGCRSGRRLCGKIEFGDKSSHLNMYYFQYFLINIYCGKKHGALLSGQPPVLKKERPELQLKSVP